MLIEKEKKEPESFYSGNSLNKTTDRIPPEAKGIQKKIKRTRTRSQKKIAKTFSKNANK